MCGDVDGVGGGVDGAVGGGDGEADGVVAGVFVGVFGGGFGAGGAITEVPEVGNVVGGCGEVDGGCEGECLCLCLLVGDVDGFDEWCGGVVGRGL